MSASQILGVVLLIVSVIMTFRNFAAFVVFISMNDAFFADSFGKHTVKILIAVNLFYTALFIGVGYLGYRLLG